MYSWNNKTEAISARLAPGLKGRIDFECQQHKGWNRNKFLNESAQFMLEAIHDMQCGNVNKKDLPGNWQRFFWGIL